MANSNMFAVFTVFVLMLLTAANPATLADSSEFKEEVFPFRNGRFFIGSIIDTFWCGNGNVSRGFDELGPNFLVDDCCRSHDLSPEFIEPGETKYNNITNNRSYTIVSCESDLQFFNCLNLVNTTSAHAVITAFSLTYPGCLSQLFKCQSPDNNYNNYPCKGYRDSKTKPNLCLTSENKCTSISIEFMIVDSQFKIHQQKLDQQKQPARTTPNNEGQNRMSHRFHPSPLPFEPTVWQLF